MNSSIPTAPSALKSVLSQASLKTVAIVDDAFDPLSAIDLKKEIYEFLDHVTRDGKDGPLSKELQSFCTTISEKDGIPLLLSSVEDFNDEILVALRRSLHLFPTLRRVAQDTIFELQIDKLSPIIDLEEELTKLGFEVLAFGSKFEFGTFRPQIIFLDYFLGVTENAAAIATARDRITEIYSLYEAEEAKPFVVLMSSRDVSDQQRSFCDEANILYGLVTFAKKEELRSRERLYYYLVSWSLDMPSRHVIQLFVEAIEASLENARTDFSRQLRSLGIEDYANLQWLSLQDEGHPLGDYMLWLLKEMLAHLVHNNERVLKSQLALDSLQVNRFLPSSSPPSLILAQLYKMALTEPGFKPADRHPASQGEGSDFHLKLGDMFFNETKGTVVMALSAACDLAYSATASTRKFPRERLILFAEGKMQLTTSTAVAASIKTEPFLHDDGKIYRICWRHRDAHWREYGQAKNWLDENGYVHKAQMSLPYALEIQKSYANNISRIGLPVQPPMSTWPTVDICCEGEDGKWHILHSVERGAQLVMRLKGDGENETLFVICRECIFVLPEVMANADKLFATQEDNLRNSIKQFTAENDKHKQKRIERAQQKLNRLSDMRAWIAAVDCSPHTCLPLILHPRVLDSSATHVELDAALPWLYTDAEYTSSFKAETPLAMNIRRYDA